MAAFTDSPAATSTPSRARLWWEIGIVLALSLGRSAVYSVLALIEALTRAPLGDQQTSLNPGAAPSAVWDVIGQFLDAFFAFAPVALAIYLLWEPARSGFAKIGLTFERFGRNLGGGALLVLVIGVPGLGLYALGRVLGITVQVDASPIDSSWWTVPLLLLAALRAGLLEEIIMVGYLFDRLRQLGWNTWAIILSTAALWTQGEPDGRTVLKRLKALPGFGDQKARIFLALLGKQYGYTGEGWREAAGAYGDEGSFRSVADIVSPESLTKVREHKRAAKAAAKAEKG